MLQEFFMFTDKKIRNCCCENSVLLETNTSNWLLSRLFVFPFTIFVQQSVGVARIFIGGGANHNSPAMTSSKFFKRGSICGAKLS